MNKIFRSLIILFCISAVGAQTVTERNYFFDTVWKNGTRVNSYYFGGNPAFLYEDDDDQRLSIFSTFSNTSGDFRRFIDPGTVRNYELSFTGKKVLDSIQIFKGTFAFQRLERDNWQWLTSRNYDRGNPFLIGDSTTGKHRYNGIIMEAKYAAKLFNKLLLGAQFDYAVDEGLKEVAPRPTSDHRDMDLRVGLGYLVNEKFNVGAVLRFYDLIEQIKYREDEGAIQQETILFKFRGYDDPFIIRKKIETRYTYHDGYFGGLNFEASPFEKTKFTGFVNIGIEQAVMKDDASNPQPEGYWKNELFTAGIKGALRLSNNIRAGLQYNFAKYDMWARHPVFDVLFMENDITSHNIIAGIDFKILQNINLMIESGLVLSDRKSRDFYSDLFWESKSTKVLGRTGFDWKLNESFKVITAGEYSITKVDDVNNSFLIGNAINSLERINDILFYQTNQDGFRGYLQVHFMPVNIGEFILYLIYEDHSPEKYFNGYRSSLNTALEFRISAF
jgi:hypothetical protein